MTLLFLYFDTGLRYHLPMKRKLVLHGMVR